MNNHSTSTFVEYLQKPVLIEVSLQERVRYYGLFLGLNLSGLLVLNWYLGVSLNLSELTVMTLMFASPILLTSLLIEALGRLKKTGQHWNIGLCLWQFWAFVIVSYTTSVLVIEVWFHQLPAFEAMTLEHAEQGHGDIHLKTVTGIVVLAYIAIQLILKRIVERENVELKKLSYAIEQKNREPSPERQELFRFTHEGESISLNVANLVFVQVEENYCHLWCLDEESTVGKKFTIRMTLADVLAKLPKALFLQTHRSYLVNLTHVRSCRRHNQNYELLLRNSEVRISVSRSKKNAVKSALKNRVSNF